MPRIVPIDDPTDPRLEPYRDVRERDLVGRRGRFIAEGKVVVEQLLASPTHRLESLLIAAHRLDSAAGMLERLDEVTPVFAVGQRVIDAIAGFPIHRGILAIGLSSDPPGASDLLASLAAEATIVALFGIANHDNMGGIFRNAAAFGVGAVFLNHQCCDPLYRKSIRVSVGAALLVPFARIASNVDVPALLAEHGFRIIALSPAGRFQLPELPPAKRNAVLLGAEGTGLSADILHRTTDVRIQMVPGFDSLNVATASGIVLHHLAVL